MRKLREIKSWVNGYLAIEEALDDLNIIFEFQKSGDATEAELDAQYKSTLSLVEELELKNMLSREEDKFGAVLKINAGAGGTGSGRYGRAPERAE